MGIMGLIKPSHGAPEHDEELDALRQQLAAADRDLTGLGAQQAHLLEQIAARERAIRRAGDAAASEHSRQAAARHATAMAERDATGKAAIAAYRALRAAGIALLALQTEVQVALRRHEVACQAAGAPSLAVAPDGRAIGAGTLPDFRAWGEA